MKKIEFGRSRRKINKQIQQLIRGTDTYKNF